MNNKEAITVLEQELAGFRDEPYDKLVSRMARARSTLSEWVLVARSTRWKVEIQVFWDDQPGRNVRVVGSIDDGGWRAFVPLNRDFVKAPDGSFVGE